MRTIDLQILRAGITVTTIKVDDTAVYSRQLMGEHRITVEFTVPQPVDIQISDYIVWKGNNFYVNIAPNVVRVAKNRLEYSVIFEALDYSLYNKIMKDEGDSRFSYFGTPEDHLLLLVENLNVYDTGWTVGNVEDIAPTTVQYEDITCREALLNMANTFGLEYVIEGKFISLLKRFEIPSNVTLSYGKGNGLYQLERQRVEDRGVITKLDVWGGAKNLPLDYRGGLRALTIEDRFITQNTALYGIREGVIRFENIFPSRTGIINGINENNPREIIDSSLDFDINDQLLGGTVAKIVFKSGALAGYEFEITEYNHTLKRITFKQIDDNGNILPDEISRPEIGDTYTLVDIMMPQSYIIQAEADLLEAAQEYLASRSFPAVTYSFDCDEKYMRDNNVDIVFGQKIRVLDNELDLDVSLRVTGISYPLSVPSRITATISEEVTFTVQDRLQKQVVDNIYEIIRVEREANKNAVVQAEQIVRSGTDGYIPRFRDVENRKELVDSSIREVTVEGVKAIEIGEIVNGLWVPRPIYASNFIKNGTGGSGGSGGSGGLVTWDNIVSKPENFPTTWSLVANKPDTATRWPSWEEVTNKPVTFAPSSHSLVSHSDVSVTSPTNVQYLGWNGTSWINRTVSWNELSNRPSIPTISGTIGRIPVFTGSSAISDSIMRQDGTQIIIDGDLVVNGYSFSYNFIKNGSGGTGGTGGTSGPVTWDNILDKPTLFPTSWDLVANKPETATRWPSWTEVTSKPTTFTPSAHTHSAADITSGTLPVGRGGTGATTFTSGNVLVGAGTGAVTTLSRSGIDTRTSFPAAAHTHPISEVVGLQTALDSKANNSITITAGTGLTGGGNLTSNRTISFDSTWGDDRYVNKSGDTLVNDYLFSGNITGVTTSDLNTVSAVARGFKFFAGNFQASNRPTGANWASGFEINAITDSGERHAVQIASASTRNMSTALQYRLITGTGNTWSPWYHFWHSGNHNPSSYVLKAGDTMTGSLAINASYYTDFRVIRDGITSYFGNSTLDGGVGVFGVASNHRLALVSNNIHHVSILPSGNVIVGQISEIAGGGRLQVKQYSSAQGVIVEANTGGFAAIDIRSDRTGSSNLGGYRAFQGTQTFAKAEINITADSNIIFSTGGGTANPVERLRINLSGDATSSSRFIASRLGFAGTYNSTQVQGIWSIGSNFAISTANNNFGSQYGLAYAYGTTGGAPFSGVHQILFVNNGTWGVSIGLQGTITTKGTITATNFIKTSDIRLKTDIRPVINWREALGHVTGYSYIKDGSREIGFIAQDVKKVLPYLVKVDEKGFMSMDYNGMIPVLWEAVKEEMSEIEKLKNKVRDLENEVSKLKQAA